MPVLAIDGRTANARQRAGVGSFCTELLRALPAVLGEWRLIVYLDAPPRAGFPLTSVQAEIRVLPRVRLWTQRALPAALAADKVDVYFSPTAHLPFCLPCKGVAMILDLAYVTFGGHFTARQRFQARLQTWWTVRKAAHLLPLSEATAQDLARLYHVPRERMTVTLAGPAPQFRPPSAGEIARVRAALNLPEHFVLYVGRIQPRKNLARLMEGFARVRAAHPELPHTLLLAGDKGWLTEGIHAAAQASAVRDHIRFLGFVEDGDLPGLIGAAEVLALVSLWEGFGLPVIEAMACGTAVLTSDCSSLPEVAGDAAALADPNDIESITLALERLLTDNAYREDLAARGPAQAAKFTWEETARRVMEGLEKALKTA